MTFQDVHQLPPGNYPYKTSTRLCCRFALDYNLVAARLTHYGLIHAPNTLRPRHEVERLMNHMNLPGVSMDRLVALIQSFVWHAINAALAPIDHRETRERYNMISDWMALAVHLRQFPQQHDHAEPFVAAFTQSVFEVASYSVPTSWRNYFCQQWATAITYTGTPPVFRWRRGN